MNWFDWLTFTALILNLLSTTRNLRASLLNSATDAAREMNKKEQEAITFMLARLAGENMQWERKYARLEADYGAALAANQDLTTKLERRTKALEACRELLETKQGIEDSSA